MTQKAGTISRLLLQEYGQPERRCDDPVAELILTVLSANTSDANSGRAFGRLMDQFGGNWDAIRTAPLPEIIDAIRIAGMYNQKAPNIQAILERLRSERGDYNIDHLATMGVADGLAYLTGFPGVGLKTASIVLLFCFDKGSFPVDTHVQRLSRRLGISGRKATPARIKTTWEALLPAESYFALHVNLIRHGRGVCLARDPRCGQCVLQNQCDYFGDMGDWCTGNAS